MEKNPVVAIAREVRAGNLQEAGLLLVGSILDFGINGNGSFKGASVVADECLRHADGDVEIAIERVIATHTRWVGVSGAVTGIGGLATMPFTIPADMTFFYWQAARMVVAIAILRGYDPDSDEVKSMVAVSLIGVAGSEALAKIGIEIGGRLGVGALKKLPGSVLTKINQKVGFRLVTKFGEKGLVNLWKVIPVVASGIGAGVNVAGMRTIAGYSKSNFTAIQSKVS